MELDHSFRVPADLDTVWQAVLDPERVAPCMPGASLTEVEGSTFAGTVKVKLGPISLMYKGSGEFLETDEAARRVVIKASGKDSRGNGTAAATVTVTLTAAGDATDGTVHTELSITGKPAQFGRGMISEVGGKILDTFAACLASKLGTSDGPGPAAAGPGAASTGGNGAGRVVSSPPGGAAGETGQAPGGRQATPQSAAAGAEHAAEADRAASAGRQAVATTDRAASNGIGSIGSGEVRNERAESEAEPIDLLSYAAPSVIKRVAPLIAAILAVLAVVVLRRRSH